MFEILSIDKIVPAKDNVRRRLGDVRDLAASIASVGIVEPLLVTPAEEPGRYVVVAGHRRLEAARRAGLADVPCTVRELSDAERVEIMLAENIARSALSPIEDDDPESEQDASDHEPAPAVRPAVTADGRASADSPPAMDVLVIIPGQP